MAKVYSWLICIVPVAVLSIVQGSCQTEHELNEQCPHDSNQSLSFIRAYGRDFTKHRYFNFMSSTDLHDKLFFEVKKKIDAEYVPTRRIKVTQNITGVEEKNVSVAPFEQPLTTIEPVIIRSRRDCLQESVRNISSLSDFKIVVTSCCALTCHHKITLRAEIGHYILLNFTDILRLDNDGISTLCSEDPDITKYIGIYVEHDIHTLYSHCQNKEPLVIFVPTNEVVLHLQVTLFETLLCLDNITITVIISPYIGNQNGDCRDMKPVEHNENEGHITTPGSYMDSYNPNKINCSVNVKVPKGKLISFHLNSLTVINGDSLSMTPLYNEQLRQFPKTITYSTSLTKAHSIVLPSNECTVQFISDGVVSGIGFNLTYSSVKEDEFIPMFSNRSLDCSRLDIIPTNMQCDFHQSCAGGEDERNCTYRHSLCGDDGYFYENNCYFVIKELPNHSWLDAEEVCAQKHQARMISINTVGESEFLESIWEQHALKVIYLGLQRMKRERVPQMYKRLWMWSDGQTGLYLPNEYRDESWTFCSVYFLNYFQSTSCLYREENYNISLICESNVIQNDYVIKPNKSNESVQKQEPNNIFKCSSGEYISRDSHCDGIHDCFDGSDESMCQQGELEVKKYGCQSGQLIRYSHVCNGRQDCKDNSDEDFCQLPDLATVPDGKMMCAKGMLIPKEKWCDGQEDCQDGSDEDSCMACADNKTIYCSLLYCFPISWKDDSEVDCPIQDWLSSQMSESRFHEYMHNGVKPPGIVYPDGYGKVEIKPLNEYNQCPPTHFQCHMGFCIPIYMLCNELKDCPYGEDEVLDVCEVQCKGLYKCKNSHICVPHIYLCNTIYDCPEKDDESRSMCDQSKQSDCPSGCSCNQTELSCKESPILNKTMSISYISIRTRHLNLDFLSNVHSFSLIFLNISGSNVRQILSEQMKFQNLLIFDASNNEIEFIHYDTFRHCPRLEQLYLAENHMSRLGKCPFLEYNKRLKVSDLSNNKNDALNDNCFEDTRKLQKLYLRNMGITRINKDAFKGLVSLITLDLRGNNIAKFSADIFKYQRNLAKLFADNFRLCCDSMMPKSLEDGQCIAPWDEVSSCTDLLRSYFLRISLWIMAALTIIGNIGVMIWRIFFDDSQRTNFRIIVTSLATSDLIMGVYLVFIGVADASFRDRYLLHEEEWKSSLACKVAGYLCLLSTEVSALFILAATIDRLLVIAFPLRRELHLTSKSATVISIIVWLIGITLSTIPLLPPFKHWNLYSQRPMGVPLPITTKDYPGSTYTFSIFIVLNSLIFIFVSAGQLIIYLSVTRRHRPQMSESRMKQDTALAKRLALVVATDCLCWFPITTMGFLAQAGIQIPVDMHVLTTVFLLPANSALNPFLYTINAIFLRRKRMKNTYSDSSTYSGPNVYRK